MGPLQKVVLLPSSQRSSKEWMGKRMEERRKTWLEWLDE